MDKATFQNPEVAAYMNEHYYNVKFDAEQKESIEILGNTFEFVPQGSRGYHELAAALLNGKMSYPTVVFMNPKFEMLSPVPGYQEATPFLKVATFFGDDIYQTVPWEEYAKQ
jgi:thioredoxin-related protein